MDNSKAPMFKVIFLKKRDGVDLIFKISHTISDGISLYHFIKELLLVVDRLYKKIKITFPYSLPDIYPDLRYFPQNLKDLDKTDQTLKLLESSLEDYPYYSVEKRSTKIIPHHFSADQTKGIIEKCKEKKITVNSLLASVLIVNLKKHVLQALKIKEEFTIKSSTAANLRSYYDIDVKAEQLGCWSGFCNVFFNSDEVKSVWDFAPIFQSRLKERINQKEPFAHWKRNVETYARNPTSAKIKKYETPIPSSLLSNIGKLDLDDWYNDNKIQLEKISFMATAHRNLANDLGFGICANTFNNRLNLTFVYMSPARTTSQAMDYTNQIVNLLL